MCQVGYLGFVLVHLQEQCPFDELGDALKHPLRGPLALAENHEVVGVPSEPVSSPFKLWSSSLSMCWRVSDWRSCLVESRFWSASTCRCQNFRLEHLVDQRNHPPVLDLFREDLQEFAVADRVKELPQVHIHDIDVPSVGVVYGLLNGRFAVSVWPEAMAAVGESLVVVCGQHY